MLGFSSVLLGTILLSATGDLGLPFGVPPTPEDTTLARIAPQDTLFYLNWAGTTAPDPKSSNQTEQLLAEPEVQNFLHQIDHAFHAAIEMGMKDKSDEEKEFARFGCQSLRIFATHSGAIFVSKPASPPNAPEENAPAEKAETESKDPEKPDAKSDSENPLNEILPLRELADFEAGLVLSLGDDAPQFESLFEKILDTYCHHRKEVKTEKPNPDDPGQANEEKTEKKANNNEESAGDDDDSADSPPIENITIDGLAWHRRQIDDLPGDWLIWGFRKGYFIATIGKEDAAERLIERIDAQPPRWLTAIPQQAPVERRTLVAYADLKRIRELVIANLEPEIRANAQIAADVLGLSNATALVEVWGLDGENFVNKTFLALDGEPQGLLRMVSEKRLSIDNLAPIPRDATSAMAFRLDPRQALDTVLDAVAKTSPEAKEEFNKQLDAAEKTLGLDIRHGIIDALGDTWCVYSSPSEGNYATVVVPLKDGPAAKLAFDRLAELLKVTLAAAQKPTAEQKPDAASDDSPSLDLSSFSPRLDRFEFEGREIFCFNCGTVAPSWCLNDNQLVFGLLPQDIKAYLTRGNRHEPMDGRSPVARLLGGEHAPSFLMYWNPRSLFRFCYSWFLMCGPTFSNYLHLFDANADPSLLPSLPAIDRHLGPSVATVRRTPQGIEFASRGTIPLPADAASFIAICVLSQYETIFQICTGAQPPQPATPENPAENQSGCGSPENAASSSSMPPSKNNENTEEP